MGPLAGARVGVPAAIATDALGNIYFTDVSAQLIRRIALTECVLRI